MFLAARPRGLSRPVHALEAIVEPDAAVTEERTVCGHLEASETDVGGAVAEAWEIRGNSSPVELPPFELSEPEDRCGQCARILLTRAAGLPERPPRYEVRGGDWVAKE